MDVIISIGYRVNSKRGTQFRQWATRRLNEYLVKGYTLKQKRLEERNFELRQLKTGIHILKRAIKEEARNLGDARMLAELLDRFSSGLSLLDDYDHESLDEVGITKKQAIEIGSDEYRKIVDAMRKDFPSTLFGREKDDSFESSTRQIYQSFNGKELYLALEEKAATLLLY